MWNGARVVEDNASIVIVSRMKMTNKSSRGGLGKHEDGRVSRVLLFVRLVVVGVLTGAVLQAL